MPAPAYVGIREGRSKQGKQLPGKVICDTVLDSGDCESQLVTRGDTRRATTEEVAQQRCTEISAMQNLTVVLLQTSLDAHAGLHVVDWQLDVTIQESRSSSESFNGEHLLVDELPAAGRIPRPGVIL